MLPGQETHQNVSIHRLRNWGSRLSGTLGRLSAYVSFDAGCLLWLLRRARQYDVVVTLTEPPLVGVIGALARKVSRRPARHVVWCMDLYTDCLFALGALSPRRPLGALLEAMNRFEMRSADAVVCLGECMRDRLVAKGVEPGRLRVIGVWNRADHLEPRPVEGNALRKELGLEDRCVVMYSGNAGRSHTFEAICEAMLELRDEARIEFVFAGGGKRLEEVERFAREQGLRNFRRLDYFPREQLNESLAVGDVHLVSLRDGMAGVVVPCKLYGIMAVGRPALYIGPAESTVGREIEQADAGRVFASNDGKGLASAIRRLAQDPEERRRLGENGRRFFLEKHEMKVCCAQWEALLEGVVRGARSDGSGGSDGSDGSGGSD